MDCAHLSSVDDIYANGQFQIAFGAEDAKQRKAAQGVDDARPFTAPRMFISVFIIVSRLIELNQCRSFSEASRDHYISICRCRLK